MNNIAPSSHPAISEDVHADIMRRLRQAEKDHEVRILLAVESGSRAWGFASDNSDYDVRFIYVHQPRWYQTVDLEDRRNVIEYPIVDEIDLNGWDIRKALKLFWKSNPAFMEWIQSPICYIQNGAFRDNAIAAVPEMYSVIDGIYHYRSMAKKTECTFLRGEDVLLKKYFYALRPLLAVRWLERYGIPAPIEFDKMLHLIEDCPDLLADVKALLSQKRNMPELGRGPRVPSIDEFVLSELSRLAKLNLDAQLDPKDITPLNAIFHLALDEMSSTL